VAAGRRGGGAPGERVSERIRAAIVDDEPPARKILHDLLAADPEVEIVAEGSAASLLPKLARTAVDLLYLDIEMPEVSGFELLERLPAGAEPVVVFVTAFDRYALRAFEVHALDYLVKPFSDARFAETLAHAKQRLRERGGMSGSAVAGLVAEVAGARQGRPLERLLVPVGPKWVVVEIDEVDWIEAADYYARLHCGAKSYLVREPLAELEARLDPARFFRIHRSAIVRLDRVAEVHAHFRSDLLVVLRNGQRLPLSRSRRKAFEERFGQRG
jgi:two-component system LytT family response regulator